LKSTFKKSILIDEQSKQITKYTNEREIRDTLNTTHTATHYTHTHTHSTHTQSLVAFWVAKVKQSSR